MHIPTIIIGLLLAVVVVCLTPGVFIKEFDVITFMTLFVFIDVILGLTAINVIKFGIFDDNALYL